MAIPKKSSRARLKGKIAAEVYKAREKLKPKKKARKRPVPRITKAKFKRAIAGTGGLKWLIADRLGCSYSTVRDLLKREDWLDVKQVFEDECERVGDMAEETVIECITQRTDLAEAGRNARWYLERRCRERGYEDQSRLRIDGGAPIQVQQSSLSLGILSLPVEVRKVILEAIEERAQKVKALNDAQDRENIVDAHKVGEKEDVDG